MQGASLRNNGIAIRVGGKVKMYGKIHGNLEELCNEVKDYRMIRVLSEGRFASLIPPLDEMLAQKENGYKHYHSKEELTKDILYSFLSPDNYTGAAIPNRIIHFWAGESMSHSAISNILAWRHLTCKNNWEHVLLTDSEANKIYNDTDLERQLQYLSFSGLDVVDVLGDPALFSDEISGIHCQLLQYLSESDKAYLPYISDLFRYAKLLQSGGVYMDVDIAPGLVDLSERLSHRSADYDIPQLGPGFRTQLNARVGNYFNTLHGDKEAGLVEAFNRLQLGNHFIATKAGSRFMENLLKITMENIAAGESRMLGP
ncbi:hypothetical protein LJC37_05000, partial [Bacteroidales bacterium OttesenSCG-928-E04]|nr:hypothetical protein [Bacteroidales bacterium OttesenSCG-928-E04]